MTTIALHQPPERMAVVRQQIAAVGRQLRGPALMLLAGLGTIGAIVLAWAASEASKRPDVFGYPLESVQTMPIWFIAVLAAAALWQRDEPSRRGYHLAMPVRGTEHTLVRVFAGWFWLMVAVAAYMVLLIVMGAGVAAIGGGKMTSNLTFWLWIEPFAAATMCYLLASIPLIASEKPLLWLVGPPAVIGAILTMPAVYEARGAMQSVERLLQSPFSPMAPFYPVYYFPRPDFRTPPHLDAMSGVLATLFWMALAVAGVWLASRRKPNATK